ncbi:MAG: hypothetical protein NW216_14535 [Hyphomicrobium sp.]|nr:hypothetical protein [Hyphomicrobium sp.]
MSVVIFLFAEERTGPARVRPRPLVVPVPIIAAIVAAFPLVIVVIAHARYAVPGRRALGAGKDAGQFFEFASVEPNSATL